MTLKCGYSIKFSILKGFSREILDQRDEKCICQYSKFNVSILKSGIFIKTLVEKYIHKWNYCRSFAKYFSLNYAKHKQSHIFLKFRAQYSKMASSIEQTESIWDMNWRVANVFRKLLLKIARPFYLLEIFKNHVSKTIRYSLPALAHVHKNFTYIRVHVKNKHGKSFFQKQNGNEKRIKYNILRKRCFLIEYLVKIFI